MKALRLTSHAPRLTSQASSLKPRASSLLLCRCRNQCGWHNWQQKREYNTLIPPLVDEIATHPAGQSPGNRESQPDRLRLAFGAHRRERLEEVMALLGSDGGTVVAHLHRHESIVHVTNYFHQTVGVADGVIQEIEQDL